MAWPRGPGTSPDLSARAHCRPDLSGAGSSLHQISNCREREIERFQYLFQILQRSPVTTLWIWGTVIQIQFKIQVLLEIPNNNSA